MNACTLDTVDFISVDINGKIVLEIYDLVFLFNFTVHLWHAQTINFPNFCHVNGENQVVLI